MKVMKLKTSLGRINRKIVNKIRKPCKVALELVFGPNWIRAVSFGSTTKMNAYSLSEHALERVTERLSMSTKWTLSQIEAGAVEVACNENSPRRHRIFWSIPDEAAFVAVVNRGTGSVITVYPARRENLSHSILTDTDPETGIIHTVYARTRTIHAAMQLAGITPPPRVQQRAFNKEFVARFVTRSGQAKTKVLGRIKDGADIDAALPAVIAKALELSAVHGTLGLTIELRNRGEMNVIQEWVLEESVSYGLNNYLGEE